MPLLVNLLDDRDEGVVLYSLKTLANCAEDYRARIALTPTVKRLDLLARHTDPAIAAAARKTIEVVTWRA